MAVGSTFLRRSLLLQFWRFLWIPRGSSTATLFPIIYSFSRIYFPVVFFNWIVTSLWAIVSAILDLLSLTWRDGIFYCSLESCFFSSSYYSSTKKKFLKRRKLYLSNQRTPFNPTIFLLNSSGDVETNPGPNDNQAKSIATKCLTCSRTVGSYHKRLLCEKCFPWLALAVLTFYPRSWNTYEPIVLWNGYAIIVHWVNFLFSVARIWTL